MPALRKAHAREGVLAPTGVIAPIPIQVETQAFVGSLAMLFACVREGKVDLGEIPLYPICAAYCRHLLVARELNLDEAAVALSALSYLLERKAWGLLPTPVPEPMDEGPLEMPEPTVHEFFPAIEALREGQEERSRRFFRPSDSGPNPYEVPLEFGDIGIADLSRALESLLLRSDPDPYMLPAKSLPPLAEQMAKILLAFGEGWMSLMDLLPGPFSRMEAVWSFLSILELVRLGQCRVRLNRGEIRFARSVRGA